MEDRKLIIDAMMKENPKLDYLLAECMVIAYEQGTLEEIMEKIDTTPREGKYTEIVGGMTIQK